MERLRRQPKKTSTNATVVHDIFQDQSWKLLPIPEFMDNYKYQMDSVDIANQLRSYYTIQQRCRRNWFLLFYWVLDTSFVTGRGYWFGFKFWLILSMFYVWFRVSFDTQYVSCVVSRYRLILDKLYETFQGYRLGVFIVIVYKAPVSLTSVFKRCYSLDLEKADFNRQSFQYTWLNSYFFGSLQDRKSVV